MDSSIVQMLWMLANGVVAIACGLVFVCSGVGSIWIISRLRFWLEAEVDRMKQDASIEKVAR